MNSRDYNLHLTRSQKWSLYFPAVMFVIMPIFFIIAFSTGPELERMNEADFPFPPLALPLFFALIGLFMLWPVITMPSRISVSPDNRLAFASRFRTVTIPASDIKSIQPSTSGWPHMPIPITTYVLKHRSGKIRFPGQFTGQHQLLSEIKQLNPNVELLGC